MSEVDGRLFSQFKNFAYCKWFWNSSTSEFSGFLLKCWTLLKGTSLAFSTLPGIWTEAKSCKIRIISQPDFLSKWSVTCIKMTIITLPELQWLLYVDLRLAFQYQFPFQQWLLSWCDRTFDFGMEIRHSWHFNNIYSRATTRLYYLWPVASWNAGLYV